VFNFIKSILLSAIDILNGASVWLIFSFILAGVLHEFLEPSKFQNMLGNTKLSSIIKATLSGMLLPICSCGVIPLGLSMYFSGAYLGPTLAFMTATPIINPIAVILCFGLLGPQISLIYIAAGFFLPILIGVVGNAFAGDELCIALEEDVTERRIALERENKTVAEKLKLGMYWVVNDMGMVVSKYVILGMLAAGFMLTVFPAAIIEQYLGNPSVLSLGSIAILSAIMYVCAVGHIPFVAALIASGATPGVAVIFLMAGTATNLPELISIHKIIGRRAMIIYSGLITVSALIIAWLTNLLLVPTFKPVISYNQTTQSIEMANRFLMVAPDSVKYLCSTIVFALCLKAYLPQVNKVVSQVKNRLLTEKVM